MQTDHSQRFVFEQQDIRGEFVHLGKSYRELLSIHHYPGAVAQLLGEFLAAAVVLSNSLKSDGTLTLQARGNGLIPLLFVECSNASTVRGIAQTSHQALPSDFGKLLGDSTLTLTVKPDDGQQYQGIVPVQGPNLARCLQHYFQQSEQINTYLILACDGRSAGGLMLQQLPAQRVADPCQRAEQWQQATILADTLADDELLTRAPEALLNRLYNEDTIRLFDSKPLHYHCSCSRDRTARALATIGQSEIEALLAERDCIEMTCELCNQIYRFERQEIETLLRSSGKPDNATTSH